MGNFELVRYHVLSSIRTAIAESSGYGEEAYRLRAQGNLRLMVMSDEELRELARMLSCLPSRPPEVVYDEIKQSIEDHKQTADEWIGALGKVHILRPHTGHPVSLLGSHIAFADDGSLRLRRGCRCAEGQRRWRLVNFHRQGLGCLSVSLVVFSEVGDAVLALICDWERNSGKIWICYWARFM